ncbi:MAG: hypothetical protein QOE08_624 [Thermoleophilaceae bacterium]|nr:hypothetical protein [Thermoleophilaceae bacterium]
MRKLKLFVSAVVAFGVLALPAGAMARDRDHDKMNDRWEARHGLNTHRNDAAGDPDKDGLKNLGEFRAHTNPRDADSNNNGIEDGDEDRDHDGVDNANELREGTNPLVRDTNHNGRSDGREDRDRDGLNNAGEDRTANDPMDRDTDNDGVKDGDEQSGTIASYDSTTKVLTINVTGHDPLSGRVTDATEIKCETEDENEDQAGDDNRARASSHGGDDAAGDDSRRDGSGDNSGPGSTSEHDGDADNQCGEADLTAGTPVHEAELTGSGQDAVWREVELLK